MKHRFIYCLLFLILLLASCGHDTNKVIVNSTVKDPEKTLPSGSSPHSPLEPAEYKGMNYLDVESLLQQAGFEKILLSPIEDIDSNSDIQDGTVELVQINNSDDYTSKTEFDKDDTVTVVYHNIPKIQAPLSSDDAGPRPYMETGKMFFEAGFKDVETDEVYDLAAGEAGYAILTAGGNLIEKDAQLPFDSSISVIGHYPVSEYPVTVSIDFVSNLIFSKYDVVVSLDGNKLGKLPHGEDAVYNLSLPAGNYSLVFTSAKDSNVVGTADLSVNSGTQTEYKISCYSKEISVKNTMFVQDLTEGKIMMPFNDWHYLRKDVKSVENELKSLGLQHVKTEATNDFYWPQDRINSVVKVEIGQKTEFKHDDLFDASASVTVYYHTANFAFKESLIHVTEKDTFEIPYTLTSGDSVDALEFEIDHPDVLKRNADGTYTALIPGEATVTAYCGGDQYSECKVEVAEIIVPVEKLVFPSDDLNVSVGKVFKPEYRIVPENANYTEIRAEISTDLIEITDDLAFYANEAGNSVISFYQEDRLLGSLNVHAVFYEIEDLVMEETADELFIGDTLILKYTLFPEEATNKGVTVASSNSEIAEVEFDERGASEVKVTGKTAGEADITILLPNGNAYTHTVTVKEVEPEEIILTMVDANQRVEVGLQIQTSVSWKPDNTSVKELSWSSSDNSIIRVNDEGILEATGVGTADITASHKSGISAQISITVEPTVVTSVKAESDWDTARKMYAGDNFKINASVSPENATNQNLTYSTDNESVAKVNDAGYVTAVGPGTATITIASDDGPKKTITVTVSQAPQKFRITWLTYCNNYNHVGYDWSKSFTVNDVPFTSGGTITLDPDSSMRVKFEVTEDDTYPDYGYFWQDIKYSDELCRDGYSISMDVPVKENSGRYSGYAAIWHLDVNVTPIR